MFSPHCFTDSTCYVNVVCGLEIASETLKLELKITLGTATLQTPEATAHLNRNRLTLVFNNKENVIITLKLFRISCTT